MIRRVGVGAWLTLVWAALWGEISLANLVSGAVVSLVLIVLFPLEHVANSGRFRPLPAVRFIGFFLTQLVVANVEVAWEVVTPRNRENEGIIAMPVVSSCSPTLLTLLVNTIGLTPGTMVIDLTDSPCVLYVHVLHLDDVEAARATLMRFQELTVRAFGCAEAIAELDQLPISGGDR